MYQAEKYPKDNHVLIFGICKYGKNYLACKIKDFEVGKLSWVIQLDQI
jgi:hypothetical protein